MREYITLVFLSLALPASAQTVPTAWKVVTDAKAVCQLAVPPDWTPFADGTGAAVFHDPTTAIAVVTSQPGQIFKPLSDSQLKTLGVPKDKVFENTAKRLFYQDKTSSSSDDPNAFSSMVPGRDGTCSCHLVAVPSITEDVARKIALSLGPVTQETQAEKKP